MRVLTKTRCSAFTQDDKARQSPWPGIAKWTLHWPWALLLVGGLLPIWAEVAWGQSGNPLPRIESLHWDQVPLGEALARLATTIGQPIFTDRRVDPQRRISLDVADAISDDVLRQIGAAASLGASRLGPIAYVGPPEAARQLRTLAALREAEIAGLSASLRATLEPGETLNWPRLSEPRQLVTRLVEARGWKLVGGERIPHDLWAAGSLGDLQFAEQLTLLLIGFDLTFRIEPSQRVIEIVPLSGPVTIHRLYPLRKQHPAESLRQSFPRATMQAQGDDLIVDATIEDHEQLARLLGGEQEGEQAPAPPPPPAKTRKLYTLRVEQQPVGAVLRQVAKQRGWTIEVDEGAIQAAGLSLDRRVSFAVQQVDEDALLKAILQPADLEFEREGENVKVFPRQQ